MFVCRGGFVFFAFFRAAGAVLPFWVGFGASGIRGFLAPVVQLLLKLKEKTLKWENTEQYLAPSNSL